MSARKLVLVEWVDAIGALNLNAGEHLGKVRPPLVSHDATNGHGPNPIPPCERSARSPSGVQAPNLHDVAGGQSPIHARLLHGCSPAARRLPAVFGSLPHGSQVTELLAGKLYNAGHSNNIAAIAVRIDGSGA